MDMVIGFTTVQCILIAVFYAFMESKGPINFINWGFQTPIFIAYGIGVIMGDPMQGAVLGAGIALVYLGVITVGASAPSNTIVGTTIGVAFAMAARLDTDAALAIALPVGVAGMFISSICMSIQVLSAQLLSKALHDRNPKMMWFWGGFAMTMKIVIYIVFMFGFLKLGNVFISNFSTAVPAWITSAFAGGAKLLPAVGLALGLKLIGGKGRIAYTIIAFLFVKVIHFSVLQIALLAAMLAVIMIYEKISSGELNLSLGGISAEKTNRILTMNDAYKTTFLYMTCYPWVFNFAKYGGEAFMLSIWPAIKKLYPNDKEKQIDELIRHDSYFNTNTYISGAIMGPILSLEEERACGNEIASAEAIDALKSSLMGPVAAIGDPLIQGVVAVILNSIGIGMVLAGNLLGPWVTALGLIAVNVVSGFVLTRVSFKYGSSMIEKLYSTGAMDTILGMGSMIGCAAFGALAAITINVSLDGIQFLNIKLQSALFDAIMPGILPLALLLVLYKLFCGEKVKAIPVVLVLFAAGFVLGALRVFG